MYAAHVAWAKAIAEREGSPAVHDDPKRTLIALRARSAERMTRAIPIYVRIHRRVQIALSVIFAIAAFVVIGFSLGWMVVGQRLAPFMVLAGFVGLMLSLVFARRVAPFVYRSVVVLLPVSAKELFARSEKIDDAHAARIAEIIRAS